MVNRALKGSAATMLSAFSLLKATRVVIYTEPTVNAQLARNMQIANAFATADCVISTRKRRDSTCVVTDPFPELKVNSFVSATSRE